MREGLRKDMRFCKFGEKEVINICDGEKLGYVEDLEFEVCSGKIKSIIVPGPCKFFGILGNEYEYCIAYEQIRRVGSDVILVEVDLEKCKRKNKY